jgi:hypothetical protein
MVQLFYAVQSVAHKCAARPPHQGFSVGRRRTSGASSGWAETTAYTLSAGQPSHSGLARRIRMRSHSAPNCGRWMHSRSRLLPKRTVATRLRDPLSVPGYAGYPPDNRMKAPVRWEHSRRGHVMPSEFIPGHRGNRPHPPWAAGVGGSLPPSNRVGQLKRPLYHDNDVREPLDEAAPGS